MNPLIQLKKATPVFLVGLVVVCFGLVQNTGAIIPAPDGCYPAFTTAEGCNALDLLTTGVGNTGVGWRSLFSNTTGSFNTGVGNGALAPKQWRLQYCSGRGSVVAQHYWN